MREIADIDVLADEVLRQRMVVLSLGMLAAGIAFVLWSRLRPIVVEAPAEEDQPS